MEFPVPLISARLVKRYKRFLADVMLDNGDIITVHCPNPGSMMGLSDPGKNVWISDSGNAKRKHRHTLELMDVGTSMVGINTNLPNRLTEEALTSGILDEFLPFETFKREVPYGEKSRVDFLLSSNNKPDTFLEVKNVHLVRTPGLHEFPDSVTSRGAKHLEELSKQVALGNRAVMLYVIQREDGDRFSLARDIDPAYGAAFDSAIENGVEAYAVKCDVSTNGIYIRHIVPIAETVLER